MRRTGLTSLVCLALVLLAACAGEATSSATVKTIAGAGERGFQDGPSAEALFAGPEGLVLAPDGTLYIAETLSGRIRKISPDGVVGTILDGDSAEFDLKLPSRLAGAPDGGIYLTDAGNNRVVRFTSEGEFETVAGTGERGDFDGPASEAEFNFPIGIAVAADGSIYVADSGNNKVRKITPDGLVTTVAGTGQEGFKDGVAAEAQFNGLNELTVDAFGNIYVTEVHNERVRKISSAGMVTTVAGSGERGFADGDPLSAKFDGPAGIGVDAAGNLYVAEIGNHRIRKIVPGKRVITYAGGSDRDLKNGPTRKSRFSIPTELVVGPDGVIYIADAGNNVVRAIVP